MEAFVRRPDERIQKEVYKARFGAGTMWTPFLLGASGNNTFKDVSWCLFTGLCLEEEVALDFVTYCVRQRGVRKAFCPVKNASEYPW